MNKEISNTISAFDRAAESYDVLEEQNVLLKSVRKKVWEVYLKEIQPVSNILELNCGTGTDAIFLAKNGYNIFATDGSAEMVNSLKLKIALLGLDNCKAAVKSFNNIGSIDEKYDAVLSNFGGLNCLKDFADLKENITKKLNDKGLFIAVVMNKFCPWEILYYTLKLNFKSAFRRFNRNGIDANVNGQRVKTFYFSPRSFAKHFKGSFTTKNLYSLLLFTPPPFLLGLQKRFPGLISFFMKIDSHIWNTFPFNRAGDHFIVVMQKV